MYEDTNQQPVWTKATYVIQTENGHINGPIWIGLGKDSKLLHAPHAVEGPKKSTRPFEKWIQETKAREDVRDLFGARINYNPTSAVIGYLERSPSGNMAYSLSSPYEQILPFIKRLNRRYDLAVQVK